VAIADVFDALTSKRPYKEAWSIEESVAFIQSQKGIHFEPALVGRFVKNLEEMREIKLRWHDDQ
jgi:putative two-component system response regulator